MNQVIDNLNEISAKLENVRHNYSSLLESLILFVENIIAVRTEIECYFDKTTKTGDNVDQLVRDHEQFRDHIMEKFRALIQQSELIIGRIRDQEPTGAKEHDTDRVISLLERLRLVFESQNEIRSTELKRESEVLKFSQELGEINKNIDDVARQLDEMEGQQLPSAAAAKVAVLGFEYFERTIQVYTLI